MAPVVRMAPMKRSSSGSGSSSGRRGSTTRRATSRRRWPGCASPKTSSPCTRSASPGSKGLAPGPTAEPAPTTPPNAGSAAPEQLSEAEVPESEAPEPDAPVAALWRGDLIESVHRGRYVVCDARGDTLDSLGDPRGLVHLRSTAKPVQALPLVFSGAADEFGITGEELAVACASHSGEPRHLAAVRSILRKAGLSEDDLQSGTHPPMHTLTAARLARNGEKPRAIHGNCSGKHASMLAVCAHAGWDTHTYRDPEGPLQMLVRRTVAKLCDLEPEAVWLAGDNFGVPVFATPPPNP